MSLKDKVFHNHMEVELRGYENCIVWNGFILSKEGWRLCGCKAYNEDLRFKAGGECWDIMKVTNPFTNDVIYDRGKIDYDKLIVDATKKLYIPIDNKVMLMSEDVIKYLEEPKLDCSTKEDGFVAKYRGVEVAKVDGKGVMRVLYEML